MKTNDSFSAADVVAIMAILVAVISGSFNLHLMIENKQLQKQAKQPKARITQTFECR